MVTLETWWLLCCRPCQGCRRLPTQAPSSISSHQKRQSATLGGPVPGHSPAVTLLTHTHTPTSLAAAAQCPGAELGTVGLDVVLKSISLLPPHPSLPGAPWHCGGPWLLRAGCWLHPQEAISHVGPHLGYFKQTCPARKTSLPEPSLAVAVEGSGLRIGHGSGGAMVLPKVVQQQGREPVGHGPLWDCSHTTSVSPG